MATPLRHRDFALLWTAGLISAGGDWMLMVAVPALLVAAVRYRPRAADGAMAEPPRRVWRDLTSGFAAIRDSHRLRVVVRFVAIIGVGEGLMGVLVVVFTERTLGGGARELGWIMSAQAVGGLLGGLLGGAVAHRVPTRWLIGAGTALMGVGDLVIFNYPRWYPELWPALCSWLASVCRPRSPWRAP